MKKLLFTLLLGCLVISLLTACSQGQTGKEKGGKKYLFHLYSGVKWHDGKEFTADDTKFTLLIRNNNQKIEDMALAFQQDMKELGIQVKVLPLDFNVLRQKYLFTYNYEACIMSQRLGPDPDGLYLAWHSS